MTKKHGPKKRKLRPHNKQGFLKLISSLRTKIRRIHSKELQFISVGIGVLSLLGTCGSLYFAWQRYRHDPQMAEVNRTSPRKIASPSYGTNPDYGPELVTPNRRGDEEGGPSTNLEELNRKPFSASSPTSAGKYCIDGDFEGAYEIRPDAILVTVRKGMIRSCRYSHYDGVRDISVRVGMASPYLVSDSNHKIAVWSQEIYIGRINPGETLGISPLQVSIPAATIRVADLFQNKLVVQLRDESFKMNNRQVLFTGSTIFSLQ